MKKYFEISNKIEGVIDETETEHAFAVFTNDENDENKEETRLSLSETMFHYHQQMGHLNDYCKAGEIRDYSVSVGGGLGYPHNIIEKALNVLFMKVPTNWETIKDWHIEFERIHPFGDGNGRVGRLLMAIQCRESGCLDELKEFFLQPGFHGMRSEYYKWFN